MSKRLILAAVLTVLWVFLSGCARAKPLRGLAGKESVADARPSPSAQRELYLEACQTPEVTRSASAPAEPAPVTVGASTRAALPILAQAATLTPTRELPPLASRPTQAAMDLDLPGTDEAVGLVRDYLGALAKRDLRTAYGMLHESYRARLAFADYARGYAGLEALEIQGIEAIEVDRTTDRVRAVLAITTRQKGSPTTSEWWAEFEVVVARGRPPYQRAISDCSMGRLRED